MTGALISYALLAALATALLVAALTDLRRRQIDNWLNAAIAVGAPVWWLAMGLGPFDVGIQIALASATFALACILFATGQMGGGDVKLLTALALWFPPGAFGQLVVLMAVLGGGASLAMAALNMKRRPGESLRDALAGVVAILWVWAACAIVFAIAMQRPVIAPTTMQAVGALLPTLWIVPLLLLAALVIFLMGFRHIMRRQKSRIEVPYGIAIAAASLWVIGSHTLGATQFAMQAG